MASPRDVAKNSAAAHAASPAASVKKLLQERRDPKDKKWQFSFAYFVQMDKFGLDGEGIPNDWLVSALERFRMLSQERVENVLQNKQNADALRYHEINWGGKKVPIERKDLTSIPAHYLDNPEDFPIDQFMISTGTGLVVGFFDEDLVFNIVLLDPLHNLQPSKSFDYAVNPSSPLNCKLTQLQMAVRESLPHCNGEGCGALTRINDALDEKTYSERYGVMLLKVEDHTTIETARAVIAEGKAKSYLEIFEEGLFHVLDK
jgi:hypothetical protein